MKQLTEELQSLGATHVVTSEQLANRVARKELLQTDVPPGIVQCALALLPVQC